MSVLSSPIIDEVEVDEARSKKCHRPRPAWRQRLVQAERGIGNGARQDSIIFVHIFTSTLILLAGGVLGLATWQWLLVFSSLILLFVSELFNQALKSLASAFDPLPPPVQKALGMSTGASMLALGGALIVAAITLGQRVTEMLG